MPTTPDQLTDEWLTDALRVAEALPPGGRITGHAAEPVTLQGATTLIARLELEYAGADSRAPASLIAKFPSPYPQMREVAGQRDFYSAEARYYAELAGEMADLVPRCFGVSYDEDTRDFVLLLEDLSAGRPGDRLAFTEADARQSIPPVAGFHASSASGRPRRLPSR